LFCKKSGKKEKHFQKIQNLRCPMFLWLYRNWILKTFDGKKAELATMNPIGF